jgi:hypothetical protein
MEDRIVFESMLELTGNESVWTNCLLNLVRLIGGGEGFGAIFDRKDVKEKFADPFNFSESRFSNMREEFIEK